MSPSRHPPRGFGVIAALIVLVLMAALAAGIIKVAYSQQSVSSQAMLGAKAGQAAASGIDYGLYQALKGTWTACAGASTTLDLSSQTGMWVTVSCSALSYNEGETAPTTARVVKLYTITATACNSSAGCPDNTRAVQPGYVERQRQAVVTN